MLIKFQQNRLTITYNCNRKNVKFSIVIRNNLAYQCKLKLDSNQRILLHFSLTTIYILYIFI